MFGFCCWLSLLQASPSSGADQLGFELAGSSSWPGSNLAFTPGSLSQLRTNFLGLTINNGVIPPDTDGAVGPEHLMVVLNSEIAIQNRQGRLLWKSRLADFWQSFGHQATFDPRVIYDSWAQRWVVTTLADPNRASSALLVAVSGDHNPLGNWSKFQVAASTNGQEWLDYPNVGYNRQWLVVTINTISLATNQFLRSSIFVFDKRFLGSDPLNHYVRFADSYFTVVPATTFDTNASPLYLVTEGGTSQTNTVYQLRLSRIEGPLGRESYVTNFAVNPTGPEWSFVPPAKDYAPQLGSPFKISSNDSRVQSLVQRNGKLWSVHHVFLPVGTNLNHSAIQWWQFNTNGVVAQRGRLEDPSGNIHYLFPSLSVNRSNDVLIGYSRFASNAYASAAYAWRRAGDPLNELSGDVVYQAGLAPYHRIRDNDENRWGDFSSTLVDPLNDMDMWTFQEYAEQPDRTGDRWGTWWACLGFQTNVPPVIVAGPQSQSIWESGTNVALSAEVAGTMPFLYQWYFNGSPLVAATNAVYALTNFQLLNVGTYLVVASNNAGYAVSDPATLAFVPPTITNLPLYLEINEGSNVSLSVSATGTIPLSYQWQQDDASLAEATNATLLITNFVSLNAGWYSVVVSNIAGTLTTNIAQLTFRPVPRPLLSDSFMAAGGPFQMNVSFESDAVITIQWSSELEHWHDLVTFTASPDTLYSLGDPGSLGARRRFYRALAKPLP